MKDKQIDTDDVVALTRADLHELDTRGLRFLIKQIQTISDRFSLRSQTLMIKIDELSRIKKLEESILNHRTEDSIKQKVTVTMHDVIRDPRKAWSRGCQNLIFEGLRE